MTDARTLDRPAAGQPEVLFVFGSFEVGGTERHLLSLIAPLNRRGWRVSVYVLSGVGQLRTAFEEAGATVILPPVLHDGSKSYGTCDGRRLLRVASHLYAIVRARKPAVIHFFLAEAYLIGAPVAIAARAPVRLMSRRSLNYYRRAHPWLWRAERPLHKMMSAVLGNSRSVVAQLREEGVPPARLGLIYNGIDATPFQRAGRGAEAKTALGIAPSRLVMTIVANLIPYKGHADLLDALALAKPRLPADWTLLVAGRDDGIGAKLRARAAAAGMESNVVFLGARTDVAALYAASDIGLLCSHEEGFSNAVLEGMAAGVPMIVTDVGGNPEAVRDGESGLVVPPRDPQRLAEAIVRLANDAALRARLGAAARQRIADEFTLEGCVARYDALYRALLAKRLPKDVPGVGVAER